MKKRKAREMEMEAKKYLIGREGTLTDLDRAVSNEIDTDSSIYDGDIIDVISKGQMGYRFWLEDEEVGTFWIYISQVSDVRTDKEGNYMHNTEDVFKIEDLEIDDY